MPQDGERARRAFFRVSPLTMMEHLLRFLIGGVAVSGFSILGDVLRPKSFAGIFGAAPSIALTTLCLAIAAQGVGYAALEARSMAIGAAALAVYSAGVCWLMKKQGLSALPATALMVFGWLACAFAIKSLFFGTGA